jgi:XamI restriction endonuclease
MPNRAKDPQLWEPDIARSVDEYNTWYLAHSPGIWADARGRAVEVAAQAMDETDNFREFTPDSLQAFPGALVVARAAVSPMMARDRLIGFAGVSGNLVRSMELQNLVPPRLRDVRSQLELLSSFLVTKLDPGLFPWIEEGRDPTAAERDKTLLVLGERLTRAFYDPELRNEQERRQKVLMRAYLQASGFRESAEAAFALPAGTFGMGRNIVGIREDGGAQNLPTDCVIRPREPDLPLVCVEMKSAGDFTNVNKRRKEESDKHAALHRAHGDAVVMLLQLFGYFDRTYLAFESSAGLDWAWDHRLDDLKPYLGL